MSNKVWYCSKCGNIHIQEEDKCPECGSLMKETAASEIEWKHKSEKDREIFTNSAKSLWGSPEPEERTTDSTEVKADKKKSKASTYILVGIVALVILLGGLWVSGYNKARVMVENRMANMITIAYTVSGMNSVSRSGFMAYMHECTDFDSRLSSL